MVFSSVVFLLYFLPLLFILYFIVPRKFKNFVLLIFSLYFYAWGEPTYVWLMVGSIFVNYFIGLRVHKDYKEAHHRKIWIVITVLFNIGMLGIFKYANFIVANINQLFHAHIQSPNIALPLGISFFTFQAMSYVIDVYRDDARHNPSFIDIALYITLFPQLVAGPIVRYQTVADQIIEREETPDKFADGIRRFIKGLAKKILIANTLGLAADQVFMASSSDVSTVTAWVGIICYSLQIYFDFSGYSDMAIGLGRMFGFEFLENFNYPYISKSVAEFWRRWHISLGTWFKDYVYFPLGGNRCSKRRHILNLAIVWFLTGVWHGASWNFIFWGVYFGSFIMAENYLLKGLLDKLWAPIRHFYLIIVVIIGWVFFRAENMSSAVSYLQSMFFPSPAGFFDASAWHLLKTFGPTLMFAILISMPVYQWLVKATSRAAADENGLVTNGLANGLVTNGLANGLVTNGLVTNGLVTNALVTVTRGKIAYHIVSSLMHMALLAYTFFQLVNSSFNPFIYFRF